MDRTQTCAAACRPWSALLSPGQPFRKGACILFRQSWGLDCGWGFPKSGADRCLRRCCIHVVKAWVGSQLRLKTASRPLLPGYSAHHCSATSLPENNFRRRSPWRTTSGTWEAWPRSCAAMHLTGPNWPLLPDTSAAHRVSIGGRRAVPAFFEWAKSTRRQWTCLGSWRRVPWWMGRWLAFRRRRPRWWSWCEAGLACGAGCYGRFRTGSVRLLKFWWSCFPWRRATSGTCSSLSGCGVRLAWFQRAWTKSWNSGCLARSTTWRFLRALWRPFRRQNASDLTYQPSS